MLPAKIETMMDSSRQADHDETEPQRRRFAGLFSWLWLIAFLAAAVAVGAWPRHESTGTSRLAAHVGLYETPPPGAIPSPRDGTFAYRSIESLRVGQRVLAHNPQLSDAQRMPEEVDPATWRMARLTMLKGDGSVLDITFLRPLEWFEWEDVPFRGGEPFGGPGVVIDLDLEEMGAVGPATLLSVSPCPPLMPANPIHDGKDRLVTGTYSHNNAHVINVYVTGEIEPIGTTASHPFWSEDRQDFVPAGKLQVGERLRSLGGGLTRVTAVGPRGPPERVYNLEVAGEHVYWVGSGATLVHNSCVTLGNKMHDDFGDELLSIVGKRPSTLRTGRGMTGVDATFESTVRGIPDISGKLAAGFRHAELKPLTESGYLSFLRQLSNWRSKGLKGNVGLFMYDESAGNAVRFIGTFK